MIRFLRGLRYSIRRRTFKHFVALRWRRAVADDQYIFLSSKRRTIRRFLASIPECPVDLIQVGNYSIISSSNINENSLIYSVGVGNNLEFDEEITERYRCPVYLFDPTPMSKELLESHPQHGEMFVFFPIGISDKNDNLVFYLPFGCGSYTLYRPTNIIDTFEAPCKTLNEVMEMLGHSHVDLLKLDIEGAALNVLWDMLHKNIQPDQILVELEPIYDSGQTLDGFLAEVAELMRQYLNSDYRIFKIERDNGNFNSIELLLAKQKLLNYNQAL